MPTMSTASTLAGGLGVNLVWLLTGTGPMTINTCSSSSQPASTGSDGLPYDGLGLSPDERVLLGIFARLTPEERRKFLRELYEYKQKVDQAIDTYVLDKKKYSNNSH